MENGQSTHKHMAALVTSAIAIPFGVAAISLEVGGGSMDALHLDVLIPGIAYLGVGAMFALVGSGVVRLPLWGWRLALAASLVVLSWLASVFALSSGFNNLPWLNTLLPPIILATVAVCALESITPREPTTPGDLTRPALERGMPIRTATPRRPALVTVAVIVGVVTGALAVFTSGYYLTRIVLGSAPNIQGISPDTFRWMELVSLVLGSILFFGAGLMWNPKRPYYYYFSVAAMSIVIIESIAAQFMLQTPVVAIGASWIATIASAFCLSVILQPRGRSYLRRTRVRNRTPPSDSVVPSSSTPRKASSDESRPPPN